MSVAWAHACIIIIACNVTKNESSANVLAIAVMLAKQAVLLSANPSAHIVRCQCTSAVLATFHSCATWMSATKLVMIVISWNIGNSSTRRCVH